MKKLSAILLLLGALFAAQPAFADDPCANPANTRSSAPINISTATTTSLVAISGTTIIYVCSFTLTISEVITTANTLVFEYGTGAACTSPTVLTGLLGAGGVLAASPIIISTANSSTLFKTAAATGLCALTAIGGSGSFQGFITYVQI